MSHRMVLTVSDVHFEWIKQIRKERGLKNGQEAVRSVLQDGFILAKKSKNTGTRTHRKRRVVKKEILT